MTISPGRGPHEPNQGKSGISSGSMAVVPSCRVGNQAKNKSFESNFKPNIITHSRARIEGFSSANSVGSEAYWQ